MHPEHSRKEGEAEAEAEAPLPCLRGAAAASVFVLMY
jgi:hypothetical protein